MPGELTASRCLSAGSESAEKSLGSSALGVSPVKGSYILIINLGEGQALTVGSLQTRSFPSGYYAYVGSAMGGFQARLRHHLREKKKPHWHIDYLLQQAAIRHIILCENQQVECVLAQGLCRQLDFVSGFGCSDCKCRSHLFFTSNEEEMRHVIIATLSSLKLKYTWSLES